MEVSGILQVNDDEEERSPIAQKASKEPSYANFIAAGITVVLLLLGFVLLSLAPAKVKEKESSSSYKPL